MRRTRRLRRWVVKVVAEFMPEGKAKVIDALSSVFSINPDLVAGVVVFVAMIDNSVLVMHTSCCLTHAQAVAEIGCEQAAARIGWRCPRQR